MKLDLTGYTVLPGLINAHDHLEFNLFPTLGHGPYRSAAEWARDIHHPARSPVREHLRVPLPVRLWWGALKNLLGGVTTVCHHNPYQPEVFTPAFPVRVLQRFAWAHSLAFEPGLVERFRHSPRAWPFILHCAEGADRASRQEVQTLDRLRVLRRRTVLVHGVALSPAGRELLRRRGASLVWCPTSNLTILGRTLSRSLLRSNLPIALATDSALSAPLDLLDELRLARRYLSPPRLYRMVTSVPAAILRISPSTTRRDYIALRSPHSGPRALFDGDLSLVVVGGRIRLIAPGLAAQLPPAQRRRFQILAVEGRSPVLVDADVRALRRAAEKHLGTDLRLAGKRILS